MDKVEKAREAERQADPANTIGGLIEAYAEKHLSKLKSGAEVRKLLDREVQPAWGATAVWTIPAARTKNGIAHEVPLSPVALAVLRSIPRLGPFVFTTDSETPTSGFSKFKSSLDKAILTLRLKAAAKMQDSEKVVRLPERWTFHDLRRTAATIMAKRGVSPHVVERLLNHVSGTISGVAKIYNRHKYWAERCAAADMLGDYVSQIVKL